MSDINLDFTVSNNSIDFTVQPNEITITPTDVQLSVYAGGFSAPGGAPLTLQYNDNGILAGIPNVTYNGSNLSLGNVANVKMTGGTNGYVLQTDGTGNLNWTAQTGGGGNGSPGGSNTQIQYNDNGTFGGNVGFTFNEVTGNVNLPNDLIVAGNIYGNFAGTSSNANYANYAGNAFSVTGSNVIGSVANATYANLAGIATLASSATIANTVTENVQSNITSVGTLTGLIVAGTSSIQQAIEKVTVTTVAANNTVYFDLLTQAILFDTTVANGNFVINFRGNSSVTLDTVMSSNQSMTATFINTNGANGYIPSSIAIDNLTRTVNWVQPAGIPTYGTINGKDVYNFNIIKTAANTYTILGSRLGYI